MKVILNIVGAQFGAEIDLTGEPFAGNPSVVDVLNKAKGVTSDRGVRFVDFQLAPPVGGQARRENTLKSVTIEVTNTIRSRKKNADGSDRGSIAPGRYTLSEKISPENGVTFTRAFQYYIEKLRAEPPKVTTTYSIDDRIVPALASNAGNGKVAIENGDTVTLRLITVISPTLTPSAV
ncbi:MAG: hypothetical protein AAGH41_12760 [Pseudomonadota bacterium]